MFASFPVCRWPMLTAYHETTGLNFTTFLCILTMAVAVARSSSDGVAIRYVLPVLWMTSCFHVWLVFPSNYERTEYNRLAAEATASVLLNDLKYQQVVTVRCAAG